jgi:hypothetical protein
MARPYNPAPSQASGFASSVASFLTGRMSANSSSTNTMVPPTPSSMASSFANGELTMRDFRCAACCGRPYPSSAWCLVNDAWCLVNDAWCLVNDAWRLVPGAWCLVPGAWCLVPDA